jgi:hypothetical protein
LDVHGAVAVELAVGLSQAAPVVVGEHFAQGGNLHGAVQVGVADEGIEEDATRL